MQKLLFSFIIYAHLKHCMPVSTLQDLHSDLQGAIQVHRRKKKTNSPVQEDGRSLASGRYSNTDTFNGIITATFGFNITSPEAKNLFSVFVSHSSNEISLYRQLGTNMTGWGVGTGTLLRQITEKSFMFQSMFYQASHENSVMEKTQNSSYLKNTLGTIKKKLGYLGCA